MKVDPNKIEQRKKGREEAQGLIGLLQSSSIGTAPYQEAFWDAIRKAFPEQLAKPQTKKQSDEPMTEMQAIYFEQNSRFPRGQYEGQLIWSVPVSYLDYWLGVPVDSFNRELARYAESDRCKKRRQEEE